jgi:LytS/YehU family sensor histidine kinase
LDQLPPLTLQLLLENAVKHNAILEETPLRIHIHTKNNHLIIENTIKRKSTLVHSNKLGLDNIRQKYKLLGGHQVLVQEDNGLFRVIIPLIKSKQHEVVDSGR